MGFSGPEIKMLAVTSQAKELRRLEQRQKDF